VYGHRRSQGVQGVQVHLPRARIPIVILLCLMAENPAVACMHQKCSGICHFQTKKSLFFSEEG